MSHGFAELLWRRKLVLALGAAMAGAAAIAMVNSLPARFTSEGLVLIDDRAPPAILELNSAPVTTPSGFNRTRTEADIIRSRKIAESIVRQLHLADRPELSAQRWPSWLLGWAAEATAAVDKVLGRDPAVSSSGSQELKETAAVEAMRRCLTVEADPRSYVLSIRFTASSGEFAAKVVNALMDAYVADELAAREKLTSQANRWLRERLETLRAEVEDADRKVQAFRETHGVVDASLQLNNEETRLAMLRQDLARAEAALAAGERVAGRPSSAAAIQESLASYVIQQLRVREAEFTQRLASTDTLGPGHPQRSADEEGLADVRREIAAEVSKVVASLRRDVERARVRVAARELAVADAQERGRRNASANVMLDQLKDERDARARVYHTFLTRVEQTTLSSAQFSSARVISPAKPPFRSDGPALPLVAMFGAFMGLFGTGALVIGRQLLRSRIGSPRELATLSGAASVGTLPKSRKWARRGMAVSILEARNGIAETLRGLQIALRGLSQSSDGATAILITSAERGDGKSTIAASLASVCAVDGLRVLIIETDLRRPRLASILGWQLGASLESVLAGERSVEDGVCVDSQTGLHGLFAVGNADSPQAMLQSQAFRDLMARARRDYELIILDSPPVLSVADPVLLAAHSDAILFAVGWERVSSKLLIEAMERLPQSMRGQMIPVLTRVPRRRLERQGYFRGYGRTVLRQAHRLTLKPAGGPQTLADLRSVSGNDSSQAAVIPSEPPTPQQPEPTAPGNTPARQQHWAPSIAAAIGALVAVVVGALMVMIPPVETADQAHRRAVDPAQRQAERAVKSRDDDQARGQAAAEAARRAEREASRKAAEQKEATAARLKSEEAERQRAAAVEATRKAEQEAARKAADDKEAAEAAARRQAEEAERQRAATAEATRMAEQEAARKAADNKEAAEAAARRQAEEAERQRAAAAEAERRAQEEAVSREAAEKNAAAEAEARLAAIETASADAIVQRAAEEIAAAEAEVRRKEEEAARAAGEATPRQAGEQAPLEAETKARAEAKAAARWREEEARRAAEEKARVEAVAREKAEADARAAAEEATRRQAAGDARPKAEEEPRRAAEARPKSAAEVRQQAEVAEAALRLSEQDRKHVQVALTSLFGQDVRTTGGTFGPRTRAMITAWQKKQGLSETGYLTAAQLTTLRQQAAPALAKYDDAQRKPGATPRGTEEQAQPPEAAEAALRLSEQDRKRVQVALNSLGHDIGGVTGYLGPRSRAMVTAWQKKQGLPETGYLTAAQLATLRQQAAPALAKYDQAQRRGEEDQPRTQ